MKILLIKDKKLLEYKLPDRVEGNIWLNEIDDKGIDRNIINVEASPDGKWRLISNSDYYIAGEGKRIPFSFLEENSLVVLNHAYSTNSLLLFTEPLFENNMSYHICSNEVSIGLTVGRNDRCNIVYNLDFIGDNDFIIKQDNDKLYLNIVKDTFPIFINGSLAHDKQKIRFGDVLFYLGIKLVFLRIDGEFVVGVNNPFNRVNTFMQTKEITVNQVEVVEDQSEDKDMEVYSQDDYFFRKPRFTYQVDELKIGIDSPPTKNEGDEMPAILTIGPMLTMSMTSVMTFYTTISSVNDGEKTIEEVMPQLVMSAAMMLSFFLWPLVTNAFQKHLRKKKEKKRQVKYSSYVDGIKQKLKEEKEKQEEIMHKSYLSLEECEKVIYEKQDRLWEKRIYDEDFLSVSLGTGTLPMKVDIGYPEEHFTMIEDKLMEKMKEIGNYNRILENVPIPFSFRDNYITALIGTPKLQGKMIDNIMLQAMAFHGYESLKIAIFTSRDNAKNWEKYKSLPHLWSNGKNLRLFATNEQEYKELTYNLDKIYVERNEKTNNNENAAIDAFNPLFLIIVDTYTAVRNLDLFTHLINSKKYLGFSLLILNDRISNIPDQCQTFIELGDVESEISRNISNSENQKFKIDDSNVDVTKCVDILSNTPLELRDEGEGAIPKKVGFLEMYGLGKIEQFNSKSRWEENSPIMNMAAMVGIGKNGEKISLDLHEKYHGPHGLIAGMTGSGKSEFIITYILSLAVNYHPEEVQFILIDYKGGGLAGAFENQTIGIKLPHLVGVITNLDKNEINRSLASIESELKRRQALFNKAREISEESTIDIYKYQEMYRNGVIDEPVSHLLIIADEFAELKQQQPEFMEQLISTARIGRSLGVHLILATQKPSGVVDSQIWSNTRFRVCLRVQEKNDSSEVIKKPDAAFLTQTGRFYLQVGYDEVFLLGQSAWTGGKYLPSDSIKKNIDTSIEFINNIGYVTKNVETKKEIKTVANYGEELINIVKYLCNIAEEEKIHTRPLWLSRIPNFILATDLIKKYSYTKENFVLNPVIGEYDVPQMQEQRLLTAPFTKEGNLLVYGTAGSGKENFITTMIYSSMLAYTPQEVNYYIMDFGSETLKYFDGSPYVGDIVYTSDSEKIDNLFKMIQKEMTERKKLFANYNGDYLTYCKNSGSSVPNIVIVINNYEGYQESYPDYDDLLNLLTRDSTKYGIYFVLAVNTPNGVRFKLKQNFGQTFSLAQNNDDDYSTILGNVRKVFPSKGFGRGLIKPDVAYEFQTAFVTEKDQIPTYIRNVNEQLKSKYSFTAKKIPVLPEVVTYDDVKEDVKGINEIALGVNKTDLSTSIYDFTKNKMNMITTQDATLFDTIMEPLITQYIYKRAYNNIVINADDMIFSDDVKKYTNYYDKDFDQVFATLTKYLADCEAKYKASNNDKTVFNGVPKVNCVIIGLTSFKNKLSAENQTKMGELFSDPSGLDLINYICVDTVDKFKKFNYDNWFKDSINPNDGIYLGSGLSDQMLINVTKRIPEMKEDVPYNFGFIIKKGIPTYVKFIEKYKE